MSDSLRDRIAMTQQAHVFCITECSCGHEFSWEKSTEWRERAELEWAQHVADAVIRELEAVPQRIMLSHASQAAESNRLDAADWLERELASVGLECGAGWVLYHLVDGVVARLNGAVDE